jgi:single-strand DNA-binding protein
LLDEVKENLRKGENMSARSLNKAQLIGNLTRDVELRYTPQGTPVATIGVATNRSWTDSSGQRQEETEFHRIVAWNKLAELCSQLLFKGRKVFFEGRLQTRKWTGQDGQERQTTEIVVDDMIVLDNRRREDRREDNRMGDMRNAPMAVSPVVKDNVVAEDEKEKEDEKVEKPVEKKKKKEEKKEKKEKKEDKKPSETEEVNADDIPF